MIARLQVLDCCSQMDIASLSHEQNIELESLMECAFDFALPELVSTKVGDRGTDAAKVEENLASWIQQLDDGFLYDRSQGLFDYKSRDPNVIEIDDDLDAEMPTTDDVIRALNEFADTL